MKNPLNMMKEKQKNRNWLRPSNVSSTIFKCQKRGSSFSSLLRKVSFSSVSTEELTKSFGWSQMDSFEQHDVSEMNRVLIDRLIEKTNVCSFFSNTSIKLSTPRKRHTVLHSTVSLKGRLSIVYGASMSTTNLYMCRAILILTQVSRGLHLWRIPSIPISPVNFWMVITNIKPKGMAINEHLR